ncbi:hypothetical protein ACFLU4_01190 [Chloroflexota bacterium]
MKLSKGGWLVLTTGTAVVLFASLGMARSGQISEQAELDIELSVVSKRLDNVQLDQLLSQRRELEAQLDQTSDELEEVRAILSQPVESIAASESLFDIAAACSVEVMRLSTADASSAELAGIDCSSLELAARVEGEVADLISFIIKLNEDLETGVVESAEITIPGESEEETRPSVDIRLVLYTYQGGER